MPRFADILGQDAAVRLLVRLVERGRLPHALLIEGIPGCGRRAVARAVAQAVLCPSRSGGDACGACSSCRLLGADGHPDMVELPADGAPVPEGWRALHRSSEGRDPGPDVLAGRTVPVCWVRDAVAECAFESAQLGHGRFFLLPGVERLGAAAANALLKVLEEPPSGVHLALTTANAGQVLGTIRSRTRLVRLHPLASEDLRRVLERGGIDPDTARLRALAGSGSHRGLWREAEPPPLEALRRLVAGGWSLAAVAAVADAVASGSGGDEGSTGAEQRRLLRVWLQVLAQDQRDGLRQGGVAAEAAVERIGRIQAAMQDLGRNLPSRLVLEVLAAGEANAGR